MVERASRTTTESVRDLASTMKISPERMLLLLRAAALPHAGENDAVTKEQKAILLRHIQSRSASASTPLPGKPETQPTHRPAAASAPRRPMSSGTTTSRISKARTSNVTVKTKGRKVLVNRPAAGHRGVEHEQPPEPVVDPGKPGQAVDERDSDVEAPVAMRSEIERIREEEASRKRAVDEGREFEDARREAEEAKRRLEEDERIGAERASLDAQEAKVEQVGANEVRTKAEPTAESEGSASKRARDRDSEKTARAGRTARGKDRDPQSEAQKIVDAQAEAVAAERSHVTKRRTKGHGPGEVVVDDDEFGDGKRRHREISLSGTSKPRRARRPAKHVSKQGGEFQQPTAAVVREVEISETITVGELAQRMSIKVGEVLKILMDLGAVATINQLLDQETAQLVVEESGHKVKLVQEDDIERELEELLELEGTPEPRPPVVTVMGHVDHGKTSLLDRIRNSKVALGEAGGITQHIGAYSVETERGKVTFIDTPGHAAFSAMRARGAGITDIVVLVVAADDGVMPQTEEAVQHAQAAEVPIVVAINKMDLEGANPEQVKNELASRGLNPEEWGGETQYVPVSAATGQGIEELLEAILLRAEILEFTAVQDMPARGSVVESRLDRGRGPVTSLLVKNGCLKRGDVVIAGECTGRVRQLINDTGRIVTQAGPSMPVEVLGMSGTPEAGSDFWVVESERRAREIAEFRFKRTAEQRAARQQAARLDVLSSLKAGERVLLGLLVKADVRGSLEAVLGALNQLGNEEVGVKIIGSGVGAINESDVTLAMASRAVVLGFNVKLEGNAKSLRDQENVEVRYFSVIYELVDEVRDMLSRLLAPEVKESVIGKAEVREVYDSPKLGQIAGCLVVDGSVVRNKLVRLRRDDQIVATSQLNSLRRFKDDVAEVLSGTECGIGIAEFNDIRIGDLIEVYEEVAVAREL